MAKDKVEPIQIFRQFAWNLAGSLANAKAGNPTRPPAKPRGRRA